MRRANENDLGKIAIVVTTDEGNGAEVEIVRIICQKTQALIKWPNDRISSISLTKLHIKE